MKTQTNNFFPKNLLNQTEFAVNTKVFKKYCLQPSDFETEEMFNQFLNEREEVCFNLIWTKDKNAEAKMAKFEKEHRTLIAQRESEIINQREVLGTWRVLPLKKQMEPKTKSRNLLNLHQKTMSSVDYSGQAFAHEAQNRKDNWTPNEDIPINIVGGSSPEWMFSKGRQEFIQALSRPQI